MKKFLLPLAIIANITISLAAGPKQTAKAYMNAFREWKPGTISHFYWDERSQEQPSWTIYDAYHIKYSTDGKISACESENPKITATYDDRERIARQELYRWDEETNEFLLEMEASYEYDPIVEDFIVLTTNTYQDRQSGEGIEIIRDADGNVTSVRDYYVNRYGAVEPGHMKNVRIEYGPDGTATDIYRTTSCNPRPYDFYDHLTDIVWENTDGQILDADIDEYDSALFFGSNRIKSATLLCDLDPTVPHGSLRVDYDGESYTAEMFMEDMQLYYYNYVFSDDKGSFICDGYEKQFSIRTDEDGSHHYEIFMAVTRHVEKACDIYGLELLDVEEWEASYYFPSLSTSQFAVENIGEVEYDPTYGYPLEYVTRQLDQTSGEYVNEYRQAFSDYISFDTSSLIFHAETANSDAQFFTLQGIKVTEPSKGIYIKVEDGKPYKVAFPKP